MTFVLPHRAAQTRIREEPPWLPRVLAGEPPNKMADVHLFGA
jgi:hypothetical protein